MDENDLQHLPSEGDQTSILKFKRCEPKKFKNSSHTAEIFGVLQSLRIDEVFCDIKLETDDGTVIFGHKVVLVSASPYFRALFTSFEERNKDCIIIKELNPTILQLLINYIYTGEIIVNNEHVKDLLAAADLIQLDYIKASCEEFLQTQLNPSNCLGIRALADLHYCTGLMSSSDAYIKKQFLEVVKYDEFLSLSPEVVIQLISSSDNAVPFEENVFESVLNWIRHELCCRKQFLPDLMEHVRLPLTSKQYLLKNVSEEPLLKNNPKCKDYVLEAIQFHLLKSQKIMTIPKNIRCKPRQSGGLQKVILTLSYSPLMDKNFISWYDPANNLCHIAQVMNEDCHPTHLALIADQFLIAVGRIQNSSMFCRCEQFIQMLDLFSQKSSWVPMVNMLDDRDRLGVGVLNNSIYAVGGENGSICLNSVEVFDINFEEWRMVSCMANKRCDVGVGILNNLLYAVGGYDNSTNEHLNSVECYDPSLDTWKLVAPMSKRRSHVGIGVLDGVMYAVGGTHGSGYFKSVEAYRPSVGVWTPVADMFFDNHSSVVVVLDGLLYVVGNTHSTNMLTIQIYNPHTNTWKLMETCINDAGFIYAAVAIDRPPHFNTD
ncbi:kelch-like protein 2 [Metopolophium dirhodum]|uniref:kelch-like protein 2 n=1 Tax=Metopolophium dirhodum TaxID=44670 RepID=UPI00298FF72D|nr:kelch-like protein 2 [Metopolophium dirhodum]XP_060866002.1 kelch-like protein 2 [Metopolophium dirhodum]XP_060866003.1 kelch-like protein 2 [Metopolophium dirhodum]XP_060866004.1 kelch-like protein 2 [Metopolophium dirhodum]XP_060866005.1 kelch-like protein 2 [Metopolophium dirhodum]XP_060866006.1 kelch-like protein 2 [Metopolophium dirhodum]XP_060866007.1 kelch-like protein 2 [Metopolophium dirhodum]